MLYDTLSHNKKSPNAMRLSLRPDLSKRNALCYTTNALATHELWSKHRAFLILKLTASLQTLPVVY